MIIVLQCQDQPRRGQRPLLRLPQRRAPHPQRLLARRHEALPLHGEAQVDRGQDRQLHFRPVSSDLLGSFRMSRPEAEPRGGGGGKLLRKPGSNFCNESTVSLSEIKGSDCFSQEWKLQLIIYLPLFYDCLPNFPLRTHSP